MNKKLHMRWKMPHAQNVQDPEGPPLHILLVDDDEDDFVITRDLLAEIRGDTFELDWVETFEAGLTAMKQNRHDVCLIDFRLGEKNGLELLSEAIKTGCTAPLILLTGQGDRTVDVEAMKRGAADYLVKNELDAPSLERAIRYAIERKQVEEAAQQLAEQRKRLLEVSQAVFSTLTLDDIVDQIEKAFEGIIHYNTCAIYWVDREAGTLKPAAPTGDTPFARHIKTKPLPLGKGITSAVLESEKGELINNAHRDPRSFYPSGIEVECEHLISIPIGTTENTLGVFNISRNSAPPFTHEEFELVQLFITQATGAIENARLHAETKRRAQQLAVLHELDRAITTSLRMTDIYHAFTQHAIRLLPYDRTSITLLDQGEIRITYIIGDNTSLPQQGTALSRIHSLPGQVIAKGQPLIQHLAREKETEETNKLWGKEIESSMSIPLRVKGQVIGTWNLGSKQRGVYSPDDLDIAQSMADQLAIAIENARLFSTAQQELSERKRVEEALRQSEEKYRTLIERMSEGLLQVDNQDVIQFVNDRFCEMVGYSRQELLNSIAADLFVQRKQNETPENSDQYETRLQKKKWGFDLGTNWRNPRG